MSGRTPEAGVEAPVTVFPGLNEDSHLPSYSHANDNNKREARMLGIPTEIFIAAVVLGPVFGVLFATLFPMMFRVLPLGPTEARARMARMPMRARIGLGIGAGGLFGAMMAVRAMTEAAGVTSLASDLIAASILIGAIGLSMVTQAMPAPKQPQTIKDQTYRRREVRKHRRACRKTLGPLGMYLFREFLNLHGRLPIDSTAIWSEAMA